MAIIQDLAGMITKLNSNDRAWRTFVYDHKDNIFEASVKVIVDESMLSRFQYKQVHLLRDNGCHRTLIWIALLINDWNSLSLISIGDIVGVPSLSQMQNMYRQYMTSSIIR